MRGAQGGWPHWTKLESELLGWAGIFLYLNLVFKFNYYLLYCTIEYFLIDGNVYISNKVV